MNMMRERNHQTQDALNPLRAQLAGKAIPPPMALYNNQKKLKKKKNPKSAPSIAGQTNSRVKSMFPAFVAAPRKHPRVLAQEHQRLQATAREEAAQAARRDHAAREATLYSHDHVREPEVIPPWDPRIFPYHNPYGLSNDGPNQAHNDQSYEDRQERIIRSIFNQVQRAEIFEAIIASNNRREADEQDRIEREFYRRDPANAPLNLRLTGPPGTKFSKAAIAARDQERADILSRLSRARQVISEVPHRSPPDDAENEALEPTPPATQDLPVPLADIDRTQGPRHVESSKGADESSGMASPPISNKPVHSGLNPMLSDHG